MLGTIVLIVTIILIAALALAGDTLLVSATTLLVTVFSFYHGVKRYGASAIVVFVAMILVISWGYETPSILTGFPFGHYYYSDLLGAEQPPRSASSRLCERPRIRDRRIAGREACLWRHDTTNAGGGLPSPPASATRPAPSLRIQLGGLQPAETYAWHCSSLMTRMCS